MLLGVTGCGRFSAPNLDAIYDPDADLQSTGYRGATHPPVIIIPGLGGTRLVNQASGKEVWPGSLRQVVFGRYRQLALPFDPNTLATLPDDLRAAGITEAAAGRDFYGRLLDTLVDHGGYVRSEPGTFVQDPSQRRLYVFPYDWRQDNVKTVRLLAEFLDRIRDDYRQPELRFDLIAHSMGGLISRYLLRFGTADVLNDNRLQVTWGGAHYINKVILLGAPNLGSVSAIEGFVRGQKVGLRRIPREVVATLPSTYQLFPHRIVKWLYDTAGNPVEFDQFDAQQWAQREWNVFAPEVVKRVEQQDSAAYLTDLQRFFAKNSERARRFSWSLTVCPNYDQAQSGCPEEIPEPPVKLVVFGGDCTLTQSRAIAEVDRHGRQVLRFRPAEVRNKQNGLSYRDVMLGPGDGTVTKPSLLARDALFPFTPRHEYSYFPLAYAFFLCAEHGELTGNVHFQDNLLDVVLTHARPWELHKDHAFSRHP